MGAADAGAAAEPVESPEGLLEVESPPPQAARAKARTANPSVIIFMMGILQRSSEPGPLDEEAQSTGKQIEPPLASKEAPFPCKKTAKRVG